MVLQLPPQKYQKKSQAKFGKKQLYKNARFNRFARTWLHSQVPVDAQKKALNFSMSYSTVYKLKTNSWNISIGVWGGVTPTFFEIFQFLPPPTPPLKGGDVKLHSVITIRKIKHFNHAIHGPLATV